MSKEPADPFDPLVETIPAGTVLFRVHDPARDATVPNPGFGEATRFAFFGDPVVPVLYAAETPEGAVHETILHDAEPGLFVPRAWWQTKALSLIEVTRDLSVVSFHSDGLRRLGLYPRDLTDTDMNEYPRTVRWAEAAWRFGADGVSYMSRHFNTSKALCLFGQRLGPTALRTLDKDTRARVFAVPDDAEWLAEVAASIRVTLRP